MSLFNNQLIENILPYDGIVTYFGKVVSGEKANDYNGKLLHSLEWKNDEAVIFGKHLITKRKVAWYGDEGFSYTYSKVTKQALTWTKELLELKHLSEELSGETYNSCLANLYHTGDEGMAWHSDDEKMLKVNSAIASMTFGAERKFCFKHKKTGEVISLLLENGSLLVMKDITQARWLHRLPTTKKINNPRINLTFRTMAVQ